MSWVIKKHEQRVRRSLAKKFGSFAALQIEFMGKQNVVDIKIARGVVTITTPGGLASVTQDWLMEQVYKEKRRRHEV